RAMPATGGDSVAVPFTPLGVVKAPNRSPNGELIAFLVHSGSNDTVGLGPSRGRDAKPTLLRGTLSDPSWAPAGPRLLALRVGGRSERYGADTALWALDPRAPAAQAQPLQLAPMPGGLVPTTIRIGPDGVSVLALGAHPGPGFRLGASGQLFRGRLDQR